MSVGLRSASFFIGFSPSISASHAALSRYICDMARSKVIVVPQIQAWEDEFPGVKGDRFSWFADEPAAAAPPQGGVPATLYPGEDGSLSSPGGFIYRLPR